MRDRERWLSAGLFLAALATLLLELLDSRLLSVLTWYHLSFFAVSLAMLGMAAGAIFVFLAGDRFEGERLTTRLPRWTMGFALAIPILWAGLSGAVLNTVRDDQDPSSRSDGLVVPPEMAGFRDLMRTLLPVVASSLGVLSILAVRSQPDAGMVLRCLGGLGLYIAGVRWWVVHRTDLRHRWQTFAAGARP